MQKSRSPLFIVATISLLISGFSAIGFLIFEYLYHQTFNVVTLVIFILTVFSISFFIVRFFIKKYISARLTPIYNLVRKKPGKEEVPQNLNLKVDVFSNLNGEVKDWMDNKNQEIQSIKNLEQYRKDYVGNISHELKTPLTSVQGYIHTLLEDVESPTLRRRFLEKAANNTERLIQIVNDLETITKIESGNIIIEFQTFNLKQLLEEVIDDLTFMTSEKQLKIQFIDGNISSYLALGDKESIRQVLNNLVINSIKYGKDNGNTTIKLYDMVDDFLIEINDNGLGIDSKHLPHIFDRFYRIDKSRNRNIGGSGLGLSIVKHIIEAHGQAITVVSELDKGTRFTFSLSKG